MRFKKWLVLIITIFLSIEIFSFGIGDWSNETPGGNKIDNFSGYCIKLKNNKAINNLQEWYFYKGFIIGSLEQESRLKYFIVNEETMKIFYFNNKEVFEITLLKMKLKPIIWTRKYSDNWMFYSSKLYILYIIGIIVSIPVTIFFLFAVYIVVFVEKFDIKSPYTFLMSVFVIFLFIRYLLDIFPQSI